MTTAPANWYPDPMGRHELRYFDGANWTDHVSDRGITAVDPVMGSAPAGSVAATPSTGGMDSFDRGMTVGNEGDPTKIAQQLTGTGHRGAGIDQPVAGGGGSIFDEPILVVNQKAKIIELNNQYSVFDQYGRQIAAVNQVGQSTAKKVLRLVSNVDQFLTHRLEISGPDGAVLLRLTRPGKVFKSTVIVSDAHEREIGRIVQENMIGKIHFGLEAGGHTVGAIRAENWRAWNFRIEDAAGHEVARITKTWEGLAKTMFTTADNYVLQIHHRQPEPLNSLIVASALSVDTALKQDSRGLG